MLTESLLRLFRHHKHHHVGTKFGQFLSQLSAEKKEGGALSDPGEPDKEEKQDRGVDGDLCDFECLPHFGSV